MIRLAPYALGAALLAGVWLHGQHTGRAACEGEHAEALARAQSQTMRAAELAARKEADRLAVEAEAERLARELEDLAHDDPATAGCGLPLGRVQRLNRY